MLFAEPDEDLLQCVLMMDDLRGADGIVANNDIRSITDLGRSRLWQFVAVLPELVAAGGRSERGRSR